MKKIQIGAIFPLCARALQRKRRELALFIEFSAKRILK
jgi:hypothetical protein